MNQTPTVISNAIVRTIGIGPGNLTQFKINGELKFEKVEWKSYCIVDCNYGGLICDNKLICRFGPNDAWSIAIQNVNGTSINGVDASRIKDVEKVKSRTAKRNKIINN
jgi:hypothetical protein